MSGDDLHWCWEECCDQGPHSCVCGNYCAPREQEDLEVVIGLNAGKFTRGPEDVRELAKILYENSVRVVASGGGFDA